MKRKVVIYRRSLKQILSNNLYTTLFTLATIGPELLHLILFQSFSDDTKGFRTLITWLLEAIGVYANVLIVFLILYAIRLIFFNERFIFDRVKQIIYYEEGVFKRTKETIAPFNGIEMVAISTTFKKHKYIAVFASTMVMFLYDGTEIKITQFPWPLWEEFAQKVKFCEKTNDEGKKVADMIGCDFFPGSEGHKVIRTYDAETGAKYKKKNLMVVPDEVLLSGNPEDF